MARKTIDFPTVMRICVELGCAPNTVYRVFRDGRAGSEKNPDGYQISRRIFAVLVRDGFLDPIEDRNE